MAVQNVGSEKSGLPHVRVADLTGENTASCGNRNSTCRNNAAPAMDCTYAWVKLVSEAQNLWPPFDHSREFGADCRSCSRLSCSRCGAIRTFGLSCRTRHGRGLCSPLFLLPCHCSLGGRTN